jgi:hypothetical protein
MQNMPIRVITTCNKRIWDEYGRRAATSFLAHWPADVRLEIYAEDFRPDIDDDRIVICGLPDWFERWKTRHAGATDANGRATPGKDYDFRRDCVRFAHKIAALTDAASWRQTGLVILMDADVIAHSAVTHEWIHQRVFPDQHAYMAWLNRHNWYPECGFVMFRADHPAHDAFMHQLRVCYESDVVFAFPETHDSFVLQQLVIAAVRRRIFREPFSLSGKAGLRSSHPFVQSVLGQCLDHLKGKRKANGRTPHAEAGRRAEPYWRK